MSSCLDALSKPWAAFCLALFGIGLSIHHAQASDIKLGEMKVECNQVGVTGTHFANVDGEVSAADEKKFVNDASVDEYLSIVKAYVLERCSGDPFVVGISFRAYAPNNGEFLAVYRSEDDVWRIDQNGIRNVYLRGLSGQAQEDEEKILRGQAEVRARKERQEAEARAKQERLKAEEKVKKQQAEVAAFQKKNKIIGWVTIDQLLANPFLFQGKVVGLKTHFYEMVSADSAVFRGVIVWGMDPTMFRTREEAAILALEIRGKSTVLISSGAASLPAAQLVDAINCSDNDCAAFRNQ